MSDEQRAFIRKHGIKRLPPGPSFHVCWGGRRIARNTHEASEADQLTMLHGTHFFDGSFRRQKYWGAKGNAATGL